MKHDEGDLETIARPDLLGQINLINAANELFDGSKPLGEFESKCLEETFRKGLKSKPTRPNRL